MPTIDPWVCLIAGNAAAAAYLAAYNHEDGQVGSVLESNRGLLSTMLGHPMTDAESELWNDVFTFLTVYFNKKRLAA